MTTTGAHPVRVTPFPNGEIGIAWSDGRESWVASHRLRCSCACAQCVDEVSGTKILRDESIPADVRPLEIHPVGNYGLAIRWSDEHDTGIYTFAKLIELGGG